MSDRPNGLPASLAWRARSAARMKGVYTAPNVRILLGSRVLATSGSSGALRVTGVDGPCSTYGAGGACANATADPRLITNASRRPCTVIVVLGTPGRRAKGGNGGTRSVARRREY